MEDKTVKFVMIMLFVSIMLLLYSVMNAQATPTGKSMNCQEINYKSTDCMNVEAVEMKYYDKEVALEEAKASKTITNVTNNINKTQVNNSSNVSNDEIKVTSSLEYSDDNDFKGYCKGYSAEEYKRNSKLQKLFIMR